MTTDERKKPYYVTTPNFHGNSAPHIGHVYSMILADVLKRWQELKSRKAVLYTGTAERGLNIQRAAAKVGEDPQDFCDKGAGVFEELVGKIDVNNDIFLRTTSRQHRDAVEYAWQILQQSGHIYEKKHEGWYSVADETFYPQIKVHLIVEPQTGRKIMVSKETGSEVEWSRERNYLFRLSGFKDRLLDFYSSNSTFITPNARMDQVVTEVQAGMPDISVSRPTENLSWGVKVPPDPSQTIWVWLDSLLGYASAVGYPFTPGSENAAGWPADVHVIGKDTLRFHCIYLPAILMALDLPLPKQILVHDYWTLGRQKVAQSTHNAVNPFFALERFGTDVLRWYLIHEGDIESGADYDNINVVKHYKRYLQRGLGNLASTIINGKHWTIAMIVKRYAISHNETKEKRLTMYEELDEQGRSLYEMINDLRDRVEEKMQALRPDEALQLISGAVTRANRGLTKKLLSLASQLGFQKSTGRNATEKKPSIRGLHGEIDRIVYLRSELLRVVGIMLQSLTPSTASKLLDLLGVDERRRSWEWCYIGIDDTYGKPYVSLEGEEGLLFPGLTSDY